MQYSKSPSIHLPDARAKKASLKTKAAQLLSSASKAGRNLNADESKVYDATIAEMFEVDAAIETHLAGAGSYTPEAAAHSAPHQRIAFGGQLRDAYARASSDERAQIDSLDSPLRDGPRLVRTCAQARMAGSLSRLLCR